MSLGRTLLSDLLPPVFDAAVDIVTGKALTRSQREGILLGLVNSIAASVDREAHDSNMREVTEFETSDRFVNKWASRSDIVTELSYSSGLDPRLCELALIMIEESTERFGVDNQLDVRGIGRISFQRTSGTPYPRADFNRELVAAVAREVSKFSWLQSRLWLFRGTDTQAANRLVYGVVAAAMFRDRLPYHIQLDDRLAFKKDVLEVRLMEPKSLSLAHF